MGDRRMKTAGILAAMLAMRPHGDGRGGDLVMPWDIERTAPGPRKPKADPQKKAKRKIAQSSKRKNRKKRK